MVNKKVCLLLAGLTIVSLQASAQKKLFNITEATNGIYTTLKPENIKQPSWQPGTDNFWQIVKTTDGDAWEYTSYPSGKTDTVLTQQSFNEGTHEHVTSLSGIKWMDHDYVYYIKDHKVGKGLLTGAGFHWEPWITLPDSADNIKIESKRRQLAYTVGNNLWMVTPDKRTIQVTNEPNKNVICGQSVHREEFGIDSGIFFSPQGNYLAYYRMDQTMVDDYPVINWDTVPATVNMIKYPMAGRTSHEVTVRVFNPTTGRTVTMQTGEPKDHYLTCVTWSPDEKYIFIAILNRDQNHLWLNKYDAMTGAKLKTLFEETNPKYVHPMHPLTFLPGSNDKFIWWSERDGFDHLYLYNTDGKLIRKLTSGNWVVNQIVGFDMPKNQVVVTTSKESPLERHIYTVSLKNANIQRIDKGPGIHTAMVSGTGKYIYDSYTAANIPMRCVIRATDGDFSKTILNAPDPLADYDRPQVREVHLKADDGTLLYGKIILPLHFDSTKKYPVIVYLYNGPNVQLIHNSFPASGSLWYEYMAQHGYIIFTMDGRGSWNRGLKFEQVTFRHLGRVECQDQMKGVAYLKSLPYVDSTRMGVHGWSFGGFMTTSLMLKYPGVFKCAVAGGPVMDWKMYEVMYTERYMDTPHDNPEGYAEADLLTKVKNLKGKLLLIHGTNDVTVVWQHSIDFLKQCVNNGVQVDYFVYPGHPHNVMGKDRVHLMQKITDYFNLYLKP